MGFFKKITRSGVKKKAPNGAFSMDLFTIISLMDDQELNP